MPVDVWLMGFDGGNGDAVPGLMDVFGIDRPRAETLLTQLPRIVKRNAPPDVGDQYAAALRSIGGTVEVRAALTAGASEGVDAPPALAPGAVAAPSNATMAAPRTAPLGAAPNPEPTASAPAACPEPAAPPTVGRFESAPLGAPLIPAEPSTRLPAAEVGPPQEPPLELGDLPIAPGLSASESQCDGPTLPSTDDGVLQSIAGGPDPRFDGGLEPTALERPGIDARDRAIANGDDSYDADLVRDIPTARQAPGPLGGPTHAPPPRPAPSPLPAPRGEPEAVGSRAAASTGWATFAVLMLVGIGSAAYGLTRTNAIGDELGGLHQPDVMYVREADLGMTMEVDECFSAPQCEYINDIFDVGEFHEFVERLYDAGATQVMFANLKNDGGVYVSSRLVVELPGDIALRAGVVSVFNEWLELGVRDQGQPYLDAALADD